LDSFFVTAVISVVYVSLQHSVATAVIPKKISTAEKSSNMSSLYKTPYEQTEIYNKNSQWMAGGNFLSLANGHNILSCSTFKQIFLSSHWLGRGRDEGGGGGESRGESADHL
jgi:hypothetical protein